MNIIVVDDTTENLAAAKEAAREFPEHKFVYTDLAWKAIAMLPGADGIITDLFFPNEGHEDFHADKLDLCMSYNDFYGKLGEAAYTPTFDKVVAEYYRGDERQAKDKHLAALDLVNEGTIRGALTDLIRVIEGQGRDASEYRKQLNDLPPPQFPYGAAVVLAAKGAGKRHVLVSDIHRHATNFDSASSAIDAMVLLLPLITEGIMTVDEVKYDGKDSRTYLGSDRINGIAGYRVGKSGPAAWAEAIRMVTNSEAS